ncbi:hypothetical protein C0J52_13759 [Blattella germanica]|nr:hypothetical protein C0J52_13759 [Blattella germanica]
MKHYISRFLNYLIEYTGASPSNFHLAGISLGAHAAAYTAKRIPGIGRLTGLDPAYFYFEGQSSEVRIDKTDAVFVDVVHTNGNPTIPYAGFGMSFPVGHVDFYFNGGWNQPGCTADVAEDAFKSVSEGKIIDALSKRLGCNHLRAVSYFAEAFSNPDCTFWGVRRNDATALVSVISGGWLSRFVSTLTKCNLDNCIPFGFKTTDFPARGSFDVATLHEKPFCVNRKDVDESMERLIQEYNHNLK